MDCRTAYERAAKSLKPFEFAASTLPAWRWNLITRCSRSSSCDPAPGKAVLLPVRLVRPQTMGLGMMDEDTGQAACTWQSRRKKVMAFGALAAAGLLIVFMIVVGVGIL